MDAHHPTRSATRWIQAESRWRRPICTIRSGCQRSNVPDLSGWRSRIARTIWATAAGAPRCRGAGGARRLVMLLSARYWAVGLTVFGVRVGLPDTGRGVNYETSRLRWL